MNRIHRICAKLEKLGTMFPDERLGQFISNHLFNDGKDPFYREDERSKGVPKDGETGEERIDKFIKENSK